MTTHDPPTTPHDHPQLDLPGQTHVAEGPHDHTGMYVMHHAFRRDLAAFASSVRATPLGDPTPGRRWRRRWARFAATLHHHHTAEDTLYWPVLLTAVEARGTEADRAEVRAMSRGARRHRPAGDGVGDGFAAVVEHPCEEHRNALDIRLAGLREVLGEHLRHEETVVLPLVQRVMTHEEFQAVETGDREVLPGARRALHRRLGDGGPARGGPRRRCSPWPAPRTGCCTRWCVAASSGPRPGRSATATAAPL